MKVINTKILSFPNYFLSFSITYALKINLYLFHLVCWEYHIMACYCSSFTNSAFNDIMLIACNWPGWA